MTTDKPVQERCWDTIPLRSDLIAVRATDDCGRRRSEYEPLRAEALQTTARRCDSDDFERGVSDETGRPFPPSTRRFQPSLLNQKGTLT